MLDTIMTTTPKSESKEIQESAQDLARARASFGLAYEAATRAHAASTDPLWEARDKERARVALAANEETHRAMIAFVADAAEHDEGEDLHPSTHAPTTRPFTSIASTSRSSVARS
jgi:hypothetical protein